MGKPSARSILYRLIEAGQLARRALHAPLAERGMEPGDEAVLFLLEGPGEASELDLCAALDTSRRQLASRIDRLAAHGMLERRAVGAHLVPGIVLTPRGVRVSELLADGWSSLEESLLADLKPKARKALRRTLGRLTTRLRP